MVSSQPYVSRNYHVKVAHSVPIFFCELSAICTNAYVSRNYHGEVAHTVPIFFFFFHIFYFFCYFVLFYPLYHNYHWHKDGVDVIFFNSLSDMENIHHLSVANCLSFGLSLEKTITTLGVLILSSLLSYLDAKSFPSFTYSSTS